MHLKSLSGAQSLRSYYIWYMTDRGWNLIGVFPKLVWLHQQASKLSNSLSTSTITRGFNAGVDNLELSASLIVSHLHVNPAIKGSKCGISRWKWHGAWVWLWLGSQSAGRTFSQCLPFTRTTIMGASSLRTSRKHTLPDSDESDIESDRKKAKRMCMDEQYPTSLTVYRHMLRQHTTTLSEQVCFSNALLHTLIT